MIRFKKRRLEIQTIVNRRQLEISRLLAARSFPNRRFFRKSRRLAIRRTFNRRQLVISRLLAIYSFLNRRQMAKNS